MSEKELKYWVPTQKVLKAKGYIRLLGKKLSYTLLNGEEVVGIIAGIDPYIGISVVRDDNPKNLLFCLHGPFDPNYRGSYLASDKLKNNYERKFLGFLSYLKKCGRTGEISTIGVRKSMDLPLLERQRGSGICPFGV